MAVKKTVKKNETATATKKHEEKTMKNETATQKTNEKPVKTPHNNIIIRVIENDKEIDVQHCESPCRMWVLNKAIFAEHPEATLKINGEKILNRMGDKELELKLVPKSDGTKWMVDMIRLRRQEAERIAKAAAKLEAKKAALHCAE